MTFLSLHYLFCCSNNNIHIYVVYVIYGMNQIKTTEKIGEAFAESYGVRVMSVKPIVEGVGEEFYRIEYASSIYPEGTIRVITAESAESIVEEYLQAAERIRRRVYA